MSNGVNQLQTSALAELQKRFCLIDLGGEIRIVDRQQLQKALDGTASDEVHFYKRADGELLMRRFLEGLPVSGNPDQAIKHFRIDPTTLVYNQVAFTPAPTPLTTLNYWRGPTAKPAPGNWRAIRDYLRDVICAGDEHVYEYLVNYLAHMLQKPEEKPGVMLFLVGGQGTGKGVYFLLIRAIWPRSTLQISDTEEVVGKFNAGLERSYPVLMDEALFAGDLKVMDRLKSMITEPVIRIEQKYQPARSVQSLHRFMAASNHDRVAHVERDDRRHVFLRVSAVRQRDTTYFANIVNCINDPNTLGAMVYYLQRRDITAFNVRNRPTTTEHSRQKIQSLTGFARYWFEVLTTSDLSGSDQGFDKWEAERFIPTADLVRDYVAFDKGASRFRTVQQSQIVEELKKLCPSATSQRRTVNAFGTNKEQRRGVMLPPIGVARHEFEGYLGCSCDW